MLSCQNLGALQLTCSDSAAALVSLFTPVHTLPCRSAFQHYLIQDYMYLQYFQQAYELTITKCDRDGHAPEVGTTTYTAVCQT